MHVVRDRSYQVSASNAHRSSLVPSPRIVGKFLESGGARGGRTHDLFRAREALSQLSYGPRSFLNYFFLFITFCFLTDSSVFLSLPKILSQLSLPSFDNVLDCILSPVISFLVTIFNLTLNPL